MHFEKNPFETEFAEASVLSNLKKEYVDLKRTAQFLQQHKNISEASKMDQKAQLIATEIIRLDPDFLKNLDLSVKKEFENESKLFNNKQHEKPDYKDLN